MNNIIDLTLPVSDTLKQHPELLDLLVQLGFKPLGNPAMRETVGRLVSLNKGCDMIHLSKEKLIQELEWNGYMVKGAETNDD
ncbi:DUF1858 domain-containing protein [Aerococcaceae bacterium DSM 111020]|nr:DUF1858 domain-containing protein [Aerococcaceae bacterium DSM 111020]